MTGEILPVSAFPESEDEIRKHVFARLRAGDQCMLLDNAERGSEVKSPVLAAMLTADEIEDRVLGGSTSERWPNRLTFMLTGNNVQLYGDLNRRFLRAEIQTDDEVPWAREFPFHPVRYVLAHRLALRAAALEIIGAWVTAGAPRTVGFGSFEEWDNLVRSVVAWVARHLDIGVGFADPVGAVLAAYEEDPEIGGLANLLAACHRCFGEKPFSIAELVKRAGKDGGFIQVGPDEAEDHTGKWLSEAIDAVHDPRKDLNRGLAAYIKAQLRRRVGGLRFMKSGEDKKTKTALWCVEVVDHAAFVEQWGGRDLALTVEALL
jgi:hypothetical protein